MCVGYRRKSLVSLISVSSLTPSLRVGRGNSAAASLDEVVKASQEGGIPAEGYTPDANVVTEKELLLLEARAVENAIGGTGMNDTETKSPKTEATEAKPRPKKSVSFSTVSVQLYPLTLGDNPSCSSGPPVQLSWHPILPSPLPIPIDAYEVTFRSSEKGMGRQSKKKLSISAKRRMDILLTPAFDVTYNSTSRMVAEMMQECEQIRKSRAKNARQTTMERVGCAV
eukprot:CAMPEP_0197457658 /NCGR_PEP_ID=MMETSP1175-20131217/46630_1 /TAXON_ID=1003142 /ORGANISM="Triceratium dubium, Strain CCMP147" /LENGTH=225 /DNA_ID=CAMNT_0042992077 /DNA_START=74 /DNA_END=748 /DNA_ORIENTATION=-